MPGPTAPAPVQAPWAQGPLPTAAGPTTPGAGRSNVPFFDPYGSGYNGTSNTGQYGLPESDPAQRLNAVQGYSSYLMGRGGPQLGINEGDAMNAHQSRGQQMQGLGLMSQYAQGNGPSVAQAQTYGQMGSNIAAMNAASQGRGGPVGAMQQGGAALNQGAMQGANARAQEQAGLMNAYGQGATAFRGGDIGQYGADVQQAFRSQQLAQAQNMLNAQTNFGFLTQEEQRGIAEQDYNRALWEQAQKQKQDSGNNDVSTLVNNGEQGAQTIGSSFSDERLKTSIMRAYGRR